MTNRRSACSERRRIFAARLGRRFGPPGGV